VTLLCFPFLFPSPSFLFPVLIDNVREWGAYNWVWMNNDDPRDPSRSLTGTEMFDLLNYGRRVTRDHNTMTTPISLSHDDGQKDGKDMHEQTKSLFPLLALRKFKTSHASPQSDPPPLTNLWVITPNLVSFTIPVMVILVRHSYCPIYQVSFDHGS
jgi:hypothetical protein